MSYFDEIIIFTVIIVIATLFLNRKFEKYSDKPTDRKAIADSIGNSIHKVTSKVSDTFIKIATKIIKFEKELIMKLYIKN